MISVSKMPNVLRYKCPCRCLPTAFDLGLLDLLGGCAVPQGLQRVVLVHRYHRQEPWKAPLPQFIEHLYHKRFGREQPQVVTPAEKWERSAAARKPARDAVATNARGDQGGLGLP